MKVEVKRIASEDWALLSVDAHVSVFKEGWSHDKERISYALVTVDENDQLVQYTTIKENDAESAYLHYGGTFPNYRGSIRAHKSFQAILVWLLERYKYVSFLTENTNWAMNKFAIHEKFRVIGVRNFNGQVMLEYWKEKEVE